MSNTRHHFDDELNALKGELIEMGSYTEQMVALSIRALLDRDEEACRKVIEMDDKADEMDISIEAHCMKLLALQQPMARDLRLIGTVSKVITDLERMCDHAVDIAKHGIKLHKYPAVIELVDVTKLSDVAELMIRSSFQAFVEHSIKLCEEVSHMDETADRLYKSMRNHVLKAITTKPEITTPAYSLLLVLLYLERIADHAVNVAERVAYVETGALKQLEYNVPGE